ncbi:MAG: MCE family protein [Acidimicrobiales bacterium]|nr:MCE family protein [Acidimicrobiales bacterium]
MTGPRVRLAGLVVGVAVLAAACSLVGGGGDTITVTATFDDVADLADGAPVQMADVRIGQVSAIELDETSQRARLELTVDVDAGVPAAVTGRVRRTSPLGEKFIELRPDPGAGGDLLEDGDEVAQTEVVPDFEQLVASGADLFGALSASQIATLLDEGARGFGGRGGDIRAVLTNLSDVAQGYARRTDDLTRVVRAVDELAATTGPAAEAHAEAIAHLAETTRILDEESDDLFDLLDSLRRLSRESSDLLETHADRMARQIDGVRAVADAVAREQDALARLLLDGPGHNEALSRGTNGDFAQVLNDFVLCGLPGGGDEPGDPVNSCSGR